MNIIKLNNFEVVELLMTFFTHTQHAKNLMHAKITWFTVYNLMIYSLINDCIYNISSHTHTYTHTHIYIYIYY